MDSTDTGTAMDAAAWPIFGLLTAIALSALFAPRVYTPVADAVLRIAGVDERLRSLDVAIEDTLRLEELAAIGARSRDMIGRVRDLLGGGAEDGSGAEGGVDGLGADAGAASGDSAADQGPEAGSESPGLVESAMRPLLVDTLALMIRALAFAGSLAGMLGLATVRMATRATRAAGRSRARMEALEARIAALETRGGGPAAR